ncbi:hypothetical protein ACVWZD_002085 [Streptomyces sp. TE3672]
MVLPLKSMLLERTAVRPHNCAPWRSRCIQ